MILRFTTAATVLVLLLAGCSNKTYYIDYGAYPQLPISGTSQRLRALAEVRTDLKARLFHGNYGGPGNEGGKPVDVLDEIFYAHDVAYIEGWRLSHLRQADRELVKQLEALDESTLSLEALALRDRAIRFFHKPASVWIGKPQDVRWGTRRKQRALPMSEYPGPPSGKNHEKTRKNAKEREMNSLSSNNTGSSKAPFPPIPFAEVHPFRG